MSKKRFAKLRKNLLIAAREMAGYPENQCFDYRDYHDFLRFSLNNVGDPFHPEGGYRLHTLDFEREVIHTLAKLFHAKTSDHWGYVTNGGTEGNLYGMYLARTLYPQGYIVCSDATHYSIYKNAEILRMKIVTIESLESGEINYEALRHYLMKHRRGFPIVIANIGTVMTGAVDNVKKIHSIMDELRVEHYYIHCDAALFGMILPFLPKRKEQQFDFSAGVDSLAVSGHKAIGSPIPSGIVITKRHYVDQIARHIEYVGAHDSTITGSRNGLTPLLWWDSLATKQKMKKLQNWAREGVQKAAYAVEQFRRRGIKAWRNPNSIIVVFPKPTAATCKKWQLATNDGLAHIITLPQVTRAVIDKIVKQTQRDLKK